MSKKIVSNKYKPAKYFQIQYGISSSTLRSWANKQLIEIQRSKGGKRFYSIDGFSQLYNNQHSHGIQPKSIKLPNKINILYCRVSSAKQKHDLERQIQELQEAYPDHQIISDICSGINFKRPGLRSLLDKCYQGLVNEIVIMHKDRLARFGFDLLEFLFQKFGVKLVVLSTSSQALQRSREQELSEDLLAIINVFVASNNGRRAAENRKRRREEEKKKNKTSEER